MPHHGEEISERIYDIVDWSWATEGGDHGEAPASVVVYAKNEGYPIEYIDRGGRLPALFFIKEGGWPRIIHHAHHTTEIYSLSIYAVDELPSYGYVETGIRTLLHSVITNMLASTKVHVPSYNLTYKMNLPYIEDVRWMGTEVRDDVQEFIDAMGLQLISARADFEIQAHGSER